MLTSSRPNAVVARASCRGSGEVVRAGKKRSKRKEGRRRAIAATAWQREQKRWAKNDGRLRTPGYLCEGCEVVQYEGCRERNRERREWRVGAGAEWGVQMFKIDRAQRRVGNWP
jgi:hypothetical protein